jgi:hypothetical protein
MTMPEVTQSAGSTIRWLRVGQRVDDVAGQRAISSQRRRLTSLRDVSLEPLGPRQGARFG